jgi:hypothetical protein
MTLPDQESLQDDFDRLVPTSETFKMILSDTSSSSKTAKELQTILKASNKCERLVKTLSAGEKIAIQKTASGSP